VCSLHAYICPRIHSREIRADVRFRDREASTRAFACPDLIPDQYALLYRRWSPRSSHAREDVMKEEKNGEDTSLRQTEVHRSARSTRERLIGELCSDVTSPITHDRFFPCHAVRYLATIHRSRNFIGERMNPAINNPHLPGSPAKLMKPLRALREKVDSRGHTIGH